MPDNDRARVARFLARRYASAREDEGRLVQDRLLAMWDRFAPYAEPHFVEEFCSGDDSRFHQRFWEMSLAEHLGRCGFSISSDDEGPDLRAAKGEHVFWLEAVVPDVGNGQNRLPEGYLHPVMGEVVTVPHQAILLRWTAAIKEKFRKYGGYRKKGIVAEGEPYIISVNSCLLGSDGFHGVSQYPHAVEAVLPVGPYQITMERQTLRPIGHGYQHRPVVLNANRQDVPTNVFLNGEYAGISAVLATHDSPDLIRPASETPLVIVHNPLASSRIAACMLCANTEYRAAVEEGGFMLQREEC